MSIENQLKSNPHSIIKSESNTSSLADLNEIKETKLDIELTEKFLEAAYTQLDSHDDDLVRDGIHYIRKYYKPSRKCIFDYFFDRVPFFNWIQKYNFKQDLAKDIIAGLTLGIVHIPSSMAYSLMAGLPPINGLYVTFFVILVYTFLGSSKHLSLGTFSIIALIVSNSVENGKGKFYEDTLLNNDTSVDRSNFISDDPTQAKIMIATAVSFTAGIIHICGAILHLGVVTKFLSDSVINGFTIAASYQILISQISTLLGLKIARSDLPLAMLGNMIEISRVIHKTNLATLAVSMISMLCLHFSKTLINDKFKKKLPVPIPFELIIVIMATIISYFAQFKEKLSINIVGKMPVGFPMFQMPKFALISAVLSDAISIAVVTYAINISIAKGCAKKHKYDIRPNQEFFAYGIGNVVVSFFGGFPSCGGLARSVIFESVSGKSQVSGFFSSSLVLMVLLFLGPQFRCLPNAVLSSIIVTTLVSKMKEITSFPIIWRKSKSEGLGWIVTFLGVLIFNVDIGLYIGLLTSIILFMIQTQRPKATVLGQLLGTDLFEEIHRFEEIKELNGIKIIRYERSVYFANVDNFKYKIKKLSENNPDELIERVNEKMKKIKNEKLKSHQEKTRCFLKCIKKTDPNIDAGFFNQVKKQIISEIDIKFIILDCSCINYIDSQGIGAILQLKESFKHIGIEIYLTYCKDAIIKAYKSFTLDEERDLDCIFATTLDAVHHAQSKMKAMQKKNNENSNESGNELNEES